MSLWYVPPAPPAPYNPPLLTPPMLSAGIALEHAILAVSKLACRMWIYGHCLCLLRTQAAVYCSAMFPRFALCVKHQKPIISYLCKKCCVVLRCTIAKQNC